MTYDVMTDDASGSSTPAGDDGDARAVYRRRRIRLRHWRSHCTINYACFKRRSLPICLNRLLDKIHT